MGFGNNRRRDEDDRGGRSNRRGGGKKGDYAVIAQVCESEEYGSEYLKPNNWAGTLLFLKRGDQKDSQEKNKVVGVYAVTSCGMTDSKTLSKRGIKVPSFILSNVSLNLEKAEKVEISDDDLETFSQLLQPLETKKSNRRRDRDSEDEEEQD
jgi:hypothetical protein